MASTNGSPPARKVLVPIATGTEEMEAVIVVDVLRRAGADVTVASVEAGTGAEGEGLEVVASRQVRLRADKGLPDCVGTQWDLVVLPGGMPGSERLRDNAALRQIVEEQVGAGRSYAAICAAPVVALDAWGLLAGKGATAHPGFSAKLADQQLVEQRVVSDGLLTTSRGPGTAFEFALALVQQLYGEEKAAAVAGPMVMRKEDGTDIGVREFGTRGSQPFRGGVVPKVLVAIADGSEEMESVIVIDVLRRAGAEVTVASVEEGRTHTLGSRGVKVVADVLLSDCVGVAYDLVYLPGGMPGAERLRDSATLRALVEAHSKAGFLTAAICAAPAVALMPWGVLEGRRATAHPNFSAKLPDQSAVDARVVVDGNVATSRGPGTAMEFALVLVAQLYGVAKAEEVAKPMVVAPSLTFSSTVAASV